MKQLLFFLFLLLAGSKAYAQLPNGSFASDFTYKDLKGVNHNLYSYLDSGYTVFIDVSATWCGPCWSYHNSHELKRLYTNHGPSGTNKVRVLFIEGDPSTSVDCLYGNCSGTQGNWVFGTTYPIIDAPAEFNDKWEIAFFPTIYMVCPSKLVYSVGTGTATVLYNKIGTCPNPKGVNNVAVKTYTGTRDVKCFPNNTMVPSFTFANQGAAKTTSASFSIKLDNETLGTYDWNGQLAPFEIATITPPAYTLSKGGKLSIDVLSVNGQTDEEAANNTLQADITYRKGKTSLKFNLTTDNYSVQDITWSLKDPSGTVVHTQKDVPGGFKNLTTYTMDIPLNASGCYSFELKDGGGDGLLNATAGGVKNNGAIQIESDGNIFWNKIDYGSGFTISFDANVTVSSEELPTVTNFQLSPNPANDQLIIQFQQEVASKVQLSVYDVTGKQVLSPLHLESVQGLNRYPINIRELQPGLYFANLKNQNGASISSRFMVIE